jgi:hypothetical protein
MITNALAVLNFVFVDDYCWILIWCAQYCVCVHVYTDQRARLASISVAPCRIVGGVGRSIQGHIKTCA